MDETAARGFVQRLTASQRRLYAFIRSQVYSRNDADEVMQQTTTVLWEKYASFRADGDLCVGPAASRDLRCWRTSETAGD